MEGGVASLGSEVLLVVKKTRCVYFVLFCALSSTSVVAQCSGCSNSSWVHSPWAPGFSLAENDLPTQFDPRWFYESTTDTWFYSPSEHPVEVGIGVTGSKDGVEVGIEVTLRPTNFEVLSLENLSYGQTSGVCAGEGYPYCAESGPCVTFFHFTVKMVANTQTSSTVVLLLNNSNHTKLRNGSPAVNVAIDQPASCNDEDQFTAVEVDIPNQWSDPDMFSVEWRCSDCPSAF